MTDTPDTDLPPISDNMRSFLDVIARPESSGRYDVRYGGKSGPQTFSDYSTHPNIAENIPDTPGYHSTAAGRYQFLNSTWEPIADKLGLKNFSPRSQDQAGAYLAKTTYNRMTGRDLETDLGNPSRYGLIADSLRSQWPTITAQNIATGYGKAIPAQETQVAQATPEAAVQTSAPTPAAPAPQQLSQLQRLALLNRLMPQQTTQPYSTVTNGDWTTALARPNTQTASYNPLLVLQKLAALKALNGDQSNALLS